MDAAKARTLSDLVITPNPIATSRALFLCRIGFAGDYSALQCRGVHSRKRWNDHAPGRRGFARGNFALGFDLRGREDDPHPRVVWRSNMQWRGRTAKIPPGKITGDKKQGPVATVANKQPIAPD
jgi:hypothetical protein